GRLLGARAVGARARDRRLRPGQTRSRPRVAAAGGRMTERALATLARGARAAGRIALDTEFMGEGRYRTLLCLIQLAIPGGTGAGERIEIVDPLAKDLDGGQLAAVLAHPAVQVVVHAGRQDIALVRRRVGTDVRNVFDTQIAAGFAGMPAQCSYESLLAKMLRVRVSKSASFTRWDTRPLSPEQLAYAREDVVHLLELAAELERRLTALGRLEWAHEECEPLESASDERDPDAIFERLPRVATLSATVRPIARELVRWRERTAARRPGPVRGAPGAPAWTGMARGPPPSPPRWRGTRGAGPGAPRGRAEELRGVARRARESPPAPPPPQPAVSTPEPDDAPLVA